MSLSIQDLRYENDFRLYYILGVNKSTKRPEYWTDFGAWTNAKFQASTFNREEAIYHLETLPAAYPDYERIVAIRS